jgi:hypothetical protein
MIGVLSSGREPYAVPRGIRFQPGAQIASNCRTAPRLKLAIRLLTPRVLQHVATVDENRRTNHSTWTRNCRALGRRYFSRNIGLKRLLR